MKPLIDYVKVELNLANDVIDNNLVAINVAYSGVEFTQIRTHGFLTFFKSLLACLQLANIGHNSVPNRTGIMESLFHRLFKVHHLLFDTLNSGINVANPSFEILNS
jgi:hypothetical protein